MGCNFFVAEDAGYGGRKYGLGKKPMDAADFERVQQELKRQLHEERLRRQGVLPLLSLDDHLINVAGELLEDLVSACVMQVFLEVLKFFKKGHWF